MGLLIRHQHPQNHRRSFLDPDGVCCPVVICVYVQSLCCQPADDPTKCPISFPKGKDPLVVKFQADTDMMFKMTIGHWLMFFFTKRN